MKLGRILTLFLTFLLFGKVYASATFSNDTTLLNPTQGLGETIDNVTDSADDLGTEVTNDTNIDENGISSSTDINVDNDIISSDTQLDINLGNSDGVSLDSNANIDAGDVNVSSDVGASVNEGGISVDANNSVDAGDISISNDLNANLDEDGLSVETNVEGEVLGNNVSVGVGANAGLDDEDPVIPSDNTGSEQNEGIGETLENSLGEASSQYPWMSATFDTISAFLSSCIEVPQFPGMEQSAISIDLDKNPRWVSTGVQVEKDKTLQIEWLGNAIQPRPKKYRVMYRIDPRFSVPQVFIQTYSYDEGKYISDFHRYKDGLLLKYQDVPEMDFANRVNDFSDYFGFVDRPKIYIHRQDVINITLDYSRNFFTGGEMSNELGSLNEMSLIYTMSPLADNRMIYSSADNFCQYAVVEGSALYNSYCNQPGLFKDGANTTIWQGRIENSAFSGTKGTLNRCADNADGKNNAPLCYYDKGRGMNISISGSSIKGMTEQFKFSPFTGKEFFYHESQLGGYLEFNTFWEIENMYEGFEQFMRDWPVEGDYFTFLSTFNAASNNAALKYLYFGRYLMEIEIGNSKYAVTSADLNNIQLEFLVSDGGLPDDSVSGTVIGTEYRGNAPADGFLYVKATRLSDNLSGSINVKFANYTGSSFISDLIYGMIIKPLRDKFNEITVLLYSRLSNDDALINALRIMIVLYIIIYALMFLAGAVEITVMDLVSRIIKISVVSILFTPTSWNFFNGYLFNVFSEGIDYFMTSVSGVTSSVGNPFGFIDPIFDRYTNPNIFALLIIQLFQIHLVLVFLAIITIYSIFLYIKAILQIIIAYCVAFVGLAVMISLAPIFISFILFERTRSMFDNWISVMFNYLIEPTILLIFFLLIDQIVTEQLLKTVLRACWGILIPLNIHLDFNSVGIPLDFNFGLPFLPGIPFYIPEIANISSIDEIFARNGTLVQIATSTFLLFAVSKLAGGMANFAHLIAQQLTNVYVEPPPGAQSAGSMAGSIEGDLGQIKAKTIGAAANWGKGFARDKLIGQKISQRRLSAALSEKARGGIDYDKFHGIDDSDDNTSPIGTTPSTGGKAFTRSASMPNLRSFGQSSSSTDTGKPELKRSESMPNLDGSRQAPAKTDGVGDGNQGQGGNLFNLGQGASGNVNQAPGFGSVGGDKKAQDSQENNVFKQTNEELGKTSETLRRESKELNVSSKTLKEKTKIPKAKPQLKRSKSTGDLKIERKGTIGKEPGSRKSSSGVKTTNNKPKK